MIEWISDVVLKDVILDIWILATASLVAASCAIVGSFLILRRQALLGDAISHSVLLGIVFAYLLTDSRALPVLLIGAAIIGLVTTWLSDYLHRVGRIQSDASIGIVFTFFFAVAVILISIYAEQIDLDQECVLYGEMAFIPFDSLSITGVNGAIEIGPRAFWTILVAFTLVIGVVTVAFHRLQTLAFHPTLAISLGINTVFWHYLLMTLVSITTVASFDAVGAILVVALLVIPASIAYLLARTLKQMLWIAIAYSQLAVVTGYGLSYWLDSSISASIAVCSGIYLLLTIMVLALRKQRIQAPLAKKA